MTMEIKMQVLKETNKKINDLKEFNIPVLLKTIDEYEKADAEKLFIDQQKALLQKAYARIDELEAKRNRIMKELARDF